MLMLNKSYKYRIYWEDTDGGGVVYYANYLKFFERARTELLRDLNISQSKLLKSHGLAFVVRRCEVDYLGSARLDDLIEVTAQVSEIKSASIIMEQEILLENKVLNKIKVEIVCVDVSNFRPKRIPSDIATSFKS